MGGLLVTQVGGGHGLKCYHTILHTLTSLIRLLPFLFQTSVDSYLLGETNGKIKH